MNRHLLTLLTIYWQLLIADKPLKKSLETFFTLQFLIYSIPISKKYEINNLACFFRSKMTPPRSQSDDPDPSNPHEQADGSQSISDKIAISFWIQQNIDPFNH